MPLRLTRRDFGPGRQQKQNLVWKGEGIQGKRQRSCCENKRLRKKRIPKCWSLKSGSQLFLNLWRQPEANEAAAKGALGEGGDCVRTLQMLWVKVCPQRGVWLHLLRRGHSPTVPTKPKEDWRRGMRAKQRDTLDTKSEKAQQPHPSI